ncbi:MAG: hypothetical protein IJV98_06590 [Clostridia bacterium]|nr:hypothetical protein [Clostridia bacterium]
MNTMIGMTQITQYMFEKATRKQLTLAQAVEQLRENANVRTVSDILSVYTGISNKQDNKLLQSCLVDALMSTAPDAKRESVMRKVRMWLKDDCLTISKLGAIQLGFGLGLTVDRTDDMLKQICGEGFHWRDPEEIVFIYGLQHGLSYAETYELYDRASAQGLLKPSELPEPITHTDTVRKQIIKLGGKEELMQYLATARKKLGKLHNTAYNLFRSFLDILVAPDLNDQLDDIKKYPIRNILTTYLYQKFIPRNQKGTKKATETDKFVMSALQRNIHQNWPDETTLSKMINREIDVTRKVLILLFLATDGGETDYADDFFDEMTPDESFRDMYMRLNGMLTDCGFAKIDPRVPFDWMVLYCMCADESIFIDGRVQRFLSEIFPTAVSDDELFDCGESGTHPLHFDT